MFWKKNKEKKTDTSALNRELTQVVALTMMSMHIIAAPELKFFYDDKGILEGLVYQHTTDNEIVSIKNQSDFTYLFVCGMHAFGAGLYVTLLQAKVKKSVGDFTERELRDIALDFCKTDVYELALSVMGLNANSNNKKVFDQIILTAIKATMNTAGNKATEPESIRQLMQVLYNAGITVIMR